MSVQNTAVLLLMGNIPTDFTAALVASTVLVGFVLLASRLSMSTSSRSFQAKNNCKPPPAYPQKDPIFALDLVFEAFSSFRSKTFLNMITQRHAKMGPTFSARSMGRPYFFTVDPENIKTVLSLRFKDYSLGERGPIMGPLLGRGIFVTDGTEWAHSRAVLRPNFVKDQVADLSMVDRHIGDLMALIRPYAQAGTTIDLQPIFLRFTLDSATEFLFNQSTDTLSHPGPKEKAFSEAFQLALNDIATAFRMGPFWRLRRTNAKVLEAYKVCRSYVDQFVDNAMALKLHQDGGGSGT